MKASKWILFLVGIIFSCQSPQSKDHNNLQGYWAFLDRYGNYNEAFFDEHSYATINRFVSEPPRFRYMVKNDSLWTNNDQRKEGLNPIAALIWIDENHVVIDAEFVTDTLERIGNAGITLANTDPKGDSLEFWPAFFERYERFLVSRGIITAEEAKAFREQQKIPEDIEQE
ncbi:MAG: hypothetical protein KQI35_16100 [Bacteroidetes bacterium]|nr:hypothetical protein [Bacteroidota bacterium]